MYQIDFNLVRDAVELSSYVLGYEKESKICSGASTLNIRFSNTITPEIISGDVLVLSEDSIQVGIFYVSATSADSRTGELEVQCVDGAKWLQDYFIDEAMETTPGQTARYWLEQIISLTGVSLVFGASNDGIDMDAVITLGLQSAYQAITTICQQNGWYFYFDADGDCIVGSVDFSPSSYLYTLGAADIINIETHEDDEMLRNRAVVWGMGDSNAEGGWVFSDESVNTAWNRDDNDLRTVVIANGAIGSKDVSDAMAYKILNEFARISFEKTVTVHGFRDMVVGEGVLVKSDLFTGIGMLTTVRTFASPEGAITEIILDERCPRLFAYFRTWDFTPGYPGYDPYYFGESVYVGTSGSGVYRKGINGTSWVSFSSGLTNLNVVDLFVNAGVLVCVTADGIAFIRTLEDTSWQGFYPQGFTDYSRESSSEKITYSWRDVEAVACTINSASGEIYIGYNSKMDFKSWVAAVSPESGNYVIKQVGVATDPFQPEDAADYYYKITDIDTNGEAILTIVDKNGASYITEATANYSGDVVSYRDGIFHGESTLEGIGVMAYHAFTYGGGELGIQSMTTCDGENIYTSSYGNTFIGGDGIWKAHRFNTYDETESTINIMTVGSNPGAQTTDNALTLWGPGRVLTRKRDVIGSIATVELIDFENQSVSTLFTLPEWFDFISPPQVLRADDGNLFVVTVGINNSDADNLAPNGKIYVYNSNTSTLSETPAYLNYNTLSSYYLPLNYGAYLTAARTTGGTTLEIYSYLINRNTGAVTSASSLYDTGLSLGSDYIARSHFQHSNESTGQIAINVIVEDTLFNTVFDEYFLTSVSSPGAFSLFSPPSVAGSLRYASKTIAAYEIPTSDVYTDFISGATHVDYSSIDPVTYPGLVNGLDPTFSDRVYRLKASTLVGSDYVSGAAWVDSVGGSGTIAWTVPGAGSAYYGGEWELVGNILFTQDSSPYDVRVLYPSRARNLKVFRTTPSSGFSEVFDIDETNNRDNLKIEVSKEFPVVLYGSKTLPDSDVPDTTKGLLYSSPTGLDGTFTYNVINEFGYGIISDMRVFDIYGTTVIASGLTVDPTGGDFNRYMLFTQPDGSLRYKHVDASLGSASIMGTFPGSLSHVETNNFSFAPHIFTSMGGTPPRMFQRLNNETTFTEKSSGLPSSEISCIRMDDFF